MERLIGLRACTVFIELVLGASLLSMSAVAQTASEPSQKTLEQSMAAHEAAREAADAKMAELMPKLVMKQALKDYSAGEYEKALPIFREVLKSGAGFDVTVAQFLLGQMSQSGFGVKKDEAEAIRYYKLAAAGGWADAHYNLGNIYYDQHHYADAAREFRTFTVKPDVAEKAKADARYKLGKLYARGDGISQDYALAAEQFALASNIGSGHNGARYELGMAYLEGKGVGQDYAEAAKHFQKAAVYNQTADQPGIADAQYALGSLYAAGKGVAQSDAEAVKYLRMAAREDHTKAQFGLGMMFAAGKGVPQSISIAYLWIARAAEGDASTRRLSDTTKAAIAGQNGTAKAITARDSIRTQMTAEQIADAQVLIDRCITSKYACNWGG